MRHDLVIFSDHHAHNHPYGAEKELHLGAIHNSRLLDSMRVIFDINQYVSEHDEVEAVLFGGDLFHKRNVFSTDVFNLTFKAIQELSFHKKVYMIPGNHDFSNRTGNLTSLDPFSAIENVHVVGHPIALDVADHLVVDFVPYSDSRETTIQGFATCEEQHDYYKATNEDYHRLLLGHCGIQGAKVGADYVLIHDGDISLDDVPYRSYDACFFGHYHKHQKLCENSWFIGATMQHNWGDVGCPRGFLHVTIEDHKVTVKQIPSAAPQFRVLADGETGDYSNDFVRVMGSSIKTDVQKEKLNNKLKNPKKLEIIPIAEEKDETEVRLTEDTLSPTKMVTAWAEKFANPELAEKIGLELLEQAGE